MDVANLKRRLKAAGRTQDDLARYLGIDRAEVSKYLSGRHKMRAERYLKIEQFLVEAETARAPGVAEARADFAARPRVRFVTLEEAKATRDAPRVRMTEEERETWLREMREIGEIGRRLPRVTDMTDDEILGYDEMP